MKNFFKSLFTPQLIDQVQSKYSGQLNVYQLGRQKYVQTNSLTQTGGLITDLWDSTLKKVHPPKNSTWLILGLASGTVASLIAKKYSPKHITGIEIDKTMLALGKKYFGLQNIPNLTIINTDAQYYLRQHTGKFDYALVDMYIQDTPPSFIYTLDFISKLSTLSETAIYNHLFYDLPKKTAAEHLLERLKIHYHSIVLHRMLTNLLIICSRPRKPV